MILEGIVTTVSKTNTLNIAPMGPHFVPGNESFELRPFDSSATYNNLKSNPFGVLHVTDDVLLIARSAINQLEEIPQTEPAQLINGMILSDACKFYEFKATELPTEQSRKSFQCAIVRSGLLREFYGFNRAKHAVLEATILATRIDFVPIEEINSQFDRLRVIVDKTGGESEITAFSLLDRYIASMICQ